MYPATICGPRAPDQVLILRDDAMVQVEGIFRTFFGLYTPYPVIFADLH